MCYFILFYYLKCTRAFWHALLNEYWLIDWLIQNVSRDSYSIPYLSYTCTLLFVRSSMPTRHHWSRHRIGSLVNILVVYCCCRSLFSSSSVWRVTGNTRAKSTSIPATRGFTFGPSQSSQLGLALRPYWPGNWLAGCLDVLAPALCNLARTLRHRPMHGS